MAEEIREVYKEEINEAEESEITQEAEDIEETGEGEAPEETEPFYGNEFESEEDFERRVKRRKAVIARKKMRRKILLIIFIIALFAGLATMCGRDIIRLKAENSALRKRQAELEEERDRLQKEVENAGKREYVQDQARKQLRLLNPGELLFIFGDEEDNK